MAPKNYQSVYAYPFDIADVGVSHFEDQLLKQGFKGVTVAVSYHAGKFLRPQAKKSAVVFPEDGSIYFEPNPHLYKTLKPLANSQKSSREVYHQLIAQQKLNVHAWTVLFHNSRLGLQHPNLCTQNACEDRYIYSLCPSNPEVQDYAKALCLDIASHKPSSIVLETPGWLPFQHGYHHEFAQVASNAWLDHHLGLCFCPACEKHATQYDIDFLGLKNRTQERIKSYLKAPIDLQADQASACLQADLLEDQDLRNLHTMRQEIVTNLLREIKALLPKEVQLAVIPTVQRPTATTFIEGTHLKNLANIVDWLEVPFYEQTAARAQADIWDTCRRSGHAEKIRAILRPGPPDLQNGSEIASVLQYLETLGITQLAFYNYGLLRPHHWENLSQLLKKSQ